MQTSRSLRGCGPPASVTNERAYAPRALHINLKQTSCGNEGTGALLRVGSHRVENSAKNISLISFGPHPLRARSWHRLGGEPVWLPACIEGFQSQALKSKVSNEPRPINQVAPPQPPGLLQKPEKPFQAVLAHPSRRLVSESREEVKCRTHAHQHRNMQFVPVFVHPSFLLRRPQTNPQHIWSGAGNDGHNFLVFLWIKRTKGWRKGSANFHCWESALERIRQTLGHVRLAAIKKMPVAASSGFLAELQHQVGAVDSSRQMVPSAPTQPNQGHAVWHNQVRRVQSLLE